MQGDFAPIAALFDIGEYAVEIADLGGELLHLTETFLHAVQPVADQLKSVLHALVEGLGELLVHGGAHLFELFFVVGTHLGEP